MPVYSVPITGPDGTAGTIQVNASDPAAAFENAKQGGNAPTGGATQVAAAPNAQTSSVNYTAGARSGGTQGADAYAKAIQQGVDALNASDLKAFNEQVREWDKVFGFNTEQWQEGIRQWNQTFGVTQAGLTGTYQGQQTQQAQNQAFNQAVAAAGLTGTYQGAPTMAQQNQLFQQQLATATLASQLQANPFRQQQVLGQANRMLAGQSVAGFQAPNTVAGVGTAGGNTQGGLGYLQQMVDDIKNPIANQTTADQFLANTPTPNKLDSNSFLRAAPSTQNLVLQAMNEKYGIDPKDALTQIQNTLPQFQAPAMGTVRR